MRPGPSTSAIASRLIVTLRNRARVRTCSRIPKLCGIGSKAKTCAARRDNGTVYVPEFAPMSQHTSVGRMNFGSSRISPSRGPRSFATRRTSHSRRIKTGIHAKSLVPPSEKVADLEQLIDEFYQSHHPTTPDARSFVDDLIRCEWTLRRLDTAETQMWLYQNDDKFRTPQKYPLGYSASCNSTPFSKLQYRLDAPRRARTRAPQALEKLKAEAKSAPAPAPPVEPDPPALDPPSLPPSPQTTSPQIGFVPPTPPQVAPGTDKTGMSFRRTLPETRCQSCLSPVSPNPHFPATIPVAESLA